MNKMIRARNNLYFLMMSRNVVLIRAACIGLMEVEGAFGDVCNFIGCYKIKNLIN